MNGRASGGWLGPDPIHPLKWEGEQSCARPVPLVMAASIKNEKGAPWSKSRQRRL